MLKAFRILAGIVAVAGILAAASWAVRDCTVAPYIYENCLWLWVKEGLGLPQSKFLRAAVLECLGLALLAGLFLVVRYVFPRPRSPQPPGRNSGTAIDARCGPSQDT